MILNSISHVFDIVYQALGVNGLEMIIYGVYFAYYCLNKLLGFDKENKYKVNLINTGNCRIILRRNYPRFWKNEENGY